MSIAFDPKLLAVVAWHVAQLGELLTQSPQSPMSNDITSNEVTEHLFYDEAVLYGFLSCQNRLHDLLVSIKQGSPMRQGQEDSIRMAVLALSLLYKEKVLTQEQVSGIDKMYLAASVLPFDNIWVEEPVKFKQYLQKIPHYFTVLLEVVQSLTNYLETAYKEEPHEVH